MRAVYSLLPVGIGVVTVCMSPKAQYKYTGTETTYSIHRLYQYNNTNKMHY
jgi:hypothetical protein